jgi:uncharacterized membrane protein
MEINGLPLHPLVVHAAVIFGPLAGLAALLYVVVPRWRDRLRWPMLVLAIVAAGAIWAAYLTGVNFRDSKEFFTQGPLAEKVDKHATWAGRLRWVTTAFGVLAIIAAWQHDRSGATRAVLGILLAAAAIGTLVLTIVTGDLGARAVWGT